jgi:hypothetical protein
MGTNNSIFEFGDKFGIESPFGDWGKNRFDLNSIPLGPENEKSQNGKSFRGSFLQKQLQLPSRVVWKLGSVESYIRSFMLKDEIGEAQTYSKADVGSDDILIGKPIQLPIGTTVVILAENVSIGEINHHRVLVFWKGAYRIGNIVDSAFIVQGLGIDQNSFFLFVNDCERVLFELKNREISSFPIVQRAFDEVSRSVKKLNEIRRSKSTIGFQNLFNRLATDYRVNEIKTGDETQSLGLVISLIKFGIGEYIEKNKILVLPFSGVWISKFINVTDFNLRYSNDKNFEYTGAYPALIELLKELNGVSDLLTDLTSSSGAIRYNVGNNDELSTVFNFLQGLIEVISLYPEMQATSFSEWLFENKLRLNLSNFKRVVVIGEKVYLSAPGTNYAEGIALRNMAGCVEALPLLTVLLHELSQGDLSYLPGDTHIDSSRTSDVLSEMQGATLAYFNQSVFDNMISGASAFKTDCLYQCCSYHQIIFLSCILQKYYRL